jgi:TonB family protein
VSTASAVDRILAARARQAEHGVKGTSIAWAVALHAAVIGTAILLPRLQPPPKPLEFVPVTVIPAQALGVRRPAPARRPAKQEASKPPEPEAPEPPDKPEEKASEPLKPEKPPEKPTAKPEAPAAPADSRKPENPASPPNATAVGETGDEAGRQGSPTGNPLGTTAFGSQIAGLDNPDFTYGYYLDRLLSLIDANWHRPSMGSGVRAVISFHIERNGSLSDLRVSESSGYNSFDLAALRAVQNAAPFPPLPRAYRHDDLGVNLIVY